MNRNGLTEFCLNAWPIGSGTIRKCSLVRVGVALLEEVCHGGGGRMLKQGLWVKVF
jgi:hypothetical protein